MDLASFVKANATPLAIAVGVAVLTAHSRFVPEGWGLIWIVAGLAAFFIARALIKPRT
jgi:hypothetical protein